MQKQRITTIRNISQSLFKRLKAKALEEDISIGAALNNAIEEWTSEKHRKKNDLGGLLKIKPFDWGKGTENTSTEIESVH